MKILAIDQAINNVGIVIMTTDNDILYRHTIKRKEMVEKLLTENPSQIHRIALIESELRKIYAEHKPDIVVREGVSILSRGNARTILNGLATVIDLAFFKLGVQVKVVAPKHAKKILTGNGNARKTEMKNTVEKKYGISVDCHQADAIALALSIITAECH